MTGRHRFMMGGKRVEILPGQFWIRFPRVTEINNPLNIEIIKSPDMEEERFYVKNIKNYEYMFFSREDIVSNYEKKLVTKMGLNEQVCEVQGWRYSKSRDNLVVFSDPEGKTEYPNYLKSPKLADELLMSLYKHDIKIKVKMGKYLIYIDKKIYEGSTREESICKAWIDKNQ